MLFKVTFFPRHNAPGATPPIPLGVAPAGVPSLLTDKPSPTRAFGPASNGPRPAPVPDWAHCIRASRLARGSNGCKADVGFDKGNMFRVELVHFAVALDHESPAQLARLGAFERKLSGFRVEFQRGRTAR